MRLYSVQSRQNGTLVRHVGSGMAWANGYIGGFLNRLTIADQSRIFRSHGNQVSKNKYVADTVSDLGI